MSNIPARASRTRDYPVQVDDVDDVPDDYYPQRRSSSAIRYTTTEGHRVIEHGNKRIVIHDEPPPRRKVHWSLIFSIGMVTVLGLWLIGSMLLTWWSVAQDDLHYGRPRTFQTDQRVGHSDDTTPSHFIAVNLNRHIEVIEFPGGDASHAKVYFAMTLVQPRGNSAGEWGDMIENRAKQSEGDFFHAPSASKTASGKLLMKLNAS